jgi:hypothetical protein
MHYNTTNTECHEYSSLEFEHKKRRLQRLKIKNLQNKIQLHSPIRQAETEFVA